MARLDAKRIVKDDIKKISTMHQILLILNSSEDYNEDYIANITHNLYLLYVEPIELMTNKAVRDTISHLNCIFVLMSFVTVIVENIRKDEFSNTKPHVRAA